MGSQDLGSEEAVQSLIDMRTGGSALRNPNAQVMMNRQIGDIILTPDQVQHLFKQYIVALLVAKKHTDHGR